MAFKTHRLVLQWVFVALFVAGVVTAALDRVVAGFSPSVWFLMSFQALALIICTEVTRIRKFLLPENENEKPARPKLWAGILAPSAIKAIASRPVLIRREVSDEREDVQPCSR